jgi:hypothetical protein
MAIAMATGAAAGAAAALAHEDGVQPRELDVSKVQKTLSEQERRMACSHLHTVPADRAVPDE